MILVEKVRTEGERTSLVGEGGVKEEITQKFQLLSTCQLPSPSQRWSDSSVTSQMSLVGEGNGRVRPGLGMRDPDTEETGFSSEVSEIAVSCIFENWLGDLP